MDRVGFRVNRRFAKATPFFQATFLSFPNYCLAQKTNHVMGHGFLMFWIFLIL